MALLENLLKPFWLHNFSEAITIFTASFKSNFFGLDGINLEHLKPAEF